MKHKQDENKAEKKSYIIIRSSLGCHESVIVVAKWAIKKGFTSTLGRTFPTFYRFPPPPPGYCTAVIRSMY